MNNIQVDNAKDVAIVMPLYNLIVYSDNYSKNIWTFMAILLIGANDAVVNYKSFKSKTKLTGKTIAAVNTKDVKIAASSHFNLVHRLRYFFCNWKMKICNNRHKHLCSRCNFITSR